MKKKFKYGECLLWLLFAGVMLAPMVAIMVECLFVIFNEQSTTAYTGVENVFYNAVDRITTKSMFTWTANTGTFTTINSMLTGLDFGTNANLIATVLTYWLLNSIVFFIIYIVVRVIEYLLNMTINRKSE